MEDVTQQTNKPADERRLKAEDLLKNLKFK